MRRNKWLRFTLRLSNLLIINDLISEGIVRGDASIDLVNTLQRGYSTFWIALIISYSEVADISSSSKVSEWKSSAMALKTFK